MNNEDKILSMLGTLTDTVGTLVTKVDKLEGDVRAIKASQLKVENEELPRIAAALDGYKVNYEKNQEHDKRITVLERKVDNYGTRVAAVELALKAK